ncbi:hypothetical protein FHS27_004748 [Rhodopirellula rubra]|uniref:Uncharacterized protein n=1 Tax=Aporhodopirellula rubra TaxID=980271 RepID=A0A7W5H7Z4_9BACT|nr:hypothetical protein [Aporhodopirellula rubra]MBB3208914.1 hypothetical protein [Aporhodopirellula rubra]
MSHGNICIVAPTGKGKSNLLKALISGQTIVFDQQSRATGWDIYKQTLQSNRSVCLDNLDDSSRLLKLGILLKPIADNATGRMIQERWYSEGLIETLIRLRGLVHTDASPLIAHTFNNWANLVYGQETEVTINDALSIFHNQEKLNEFIMGCNRKEARLFWSDLPSNPSSRERIVGALDRLLEPLRSPSIAIRTSRESRFIELIDEGFSYVLEGGRVASGTDMRLAISLRLKEVVRYKMQGGKRDLTIVLEESQALGLTLQEANYLRTLRKFGVRWIIIAQEAKWD